MWPEAILGMHVADIQLSSTLPNWASSNVPPAKRSPNRPAGKSTCHINIAKLAGCAARQPFAAFQLRLGRLRAKRVALLTVLCDFQRVCS